MPNAVARLGGIYDSSTYRGDRLFFRAKMLRLNWSEITIKIAHTSWISIYSLGRHPHPETNNFQRRNGEYANIRLRKLRAPCIGLWVWGKCGICGAKSRHASAPNPQLSSTILSYLLRYHIVRLRIGAVIRTIFNSPSPSLCPYTHHPCVHIPGPNRIRGH